jgi:hypothetical protein
MTQAYTIAAIDPGVTGGAIRLDVDGERVVVEAWCAWRDHTKRERQVWRLLLCEGGPPSEMVGMDRADMIHCVASHLGVTWEGVDAWVLESPMVGRSVSSAMALAEECGMWRQALGRVGHEPVRAHPSTWRKVLGIGCGENSTEAHDARLRAYLAARGITLATRHLEAAAGMALAVAEVARARGLDPVSAWAAMEAEAEAERKAEKAAKRAREEKRNAGAGLASGGVGRVKSGRGKGSKAKKPGEAQNGPN